MSAEDLHPIPFLRPTPEVDRLKMARIRHSLESIRKETQIWSEASESEEDWQDLMKTIELGFDSATVGAGVGTLVPPAPEPPKRWPMFDKKKPSGSAQEEHTSDDEENAAFFASPPPSRMRKLTLKTFSVAKTLRKNFKKFRSTPDLKLSPNIVKRTEWRYASNTKHLPRLLLKPAEDQEDIPVLDISRAYISTVQECGTAELATCEDVNDGSPSDVPQVEEPMLIPPGV